MSRRTSTVLLGANLALMLILLGVNFVVVPPEPLIIGAPLASTGAVVGQVEVKTSEAKRWVPAKVGQRLVAGDEIRTGMFSEVVLHLTGTSSVVVSANTSFVIAEDLVQLSSFELGVGQIRADIPRDSDREYQFRSRGSDAVASSSSGEFSMSTDGAGTVVVDTHSGNVKVKARNKTVEVKKGRRSVVLPEKAPSKVLTIPTSVALQVRWPKSKIQKTRTTVSGKTSAGSTVLINGIVVRADAHGLFSLDVPLREGSNRLVVSTSDSAGNTLTRESAEILVDTKPPDLQIDAKDLWK